MGSICVVIYVIKGKIRVFFSFFNSEPDWDCFRKFKNNFKKLIVYYSIW